MQKWMKAIAIATGVLMIGGGIFLMQVNPREAGALPEGFRSPIIALEFTESVEQLEAFFDVSNPLALRQQLYTGNLYDYAFMVLYSLFALFCGVLIFLETRIKTVFLVIFPILLALAADAMENLYIGAICSLSEWSGTAPLLKQLHFYTWLKWGSIASVMAFFSVYFLQGVWWKKLMGLVLVANFALFITAFFLRGVWIEPMTLSVFGSYAVLFIFSLLWKPGSHSAVVDGE
jgi:hypothetical protein